MRSQLEQLRTMTSVVADTGDIEAIAQLKPEDATTNPSLILKAMQSADAQSRIQAAVERLSNEGEEQTPHSVARLLSVDLGKDILELIPGRVSTEVDARLSYNTEATIEEAHRIIDCYQKMDVEPERLLIKIASTWEGIRAAEQLESEGIACNLTLLFGFCQAQACADAGVTLISPFVGRIYDWYRKHLNRDHLEPEEDPGVQSVQRIYRYYKEHGYATIVMGASFRHIGQIQALAGCDKLTISPALLSELAQTHAHLPQVLSVSDAQATPESPPRDLTETDFRWQLNEDAMATEKLAEGIRLFARDQNQLEDLLKERMKSS